MIIKGDRRGGAKQLADHLLRRDTNEEVHIRETENYPQNELSDQNLRSALQLMESQAYAKGKHRTLYHAIMAPQQGEKLTKKQLEYAVDMLARNLGLEGHQRVIVEHRKAGRQHFHVIFNIINPNTGLLARLQWTRKKQWNTARQLEQDLGLKPVIATGRPARQWEMQRGKRSGINPLEVRKQVTAIYRASKTGGEFILALSKAGYVMTKGRNNSYVIVDRAGHIHGLLRRIEGAKLKDLRRKFPDLKNLAYPPLDAVLRNLRLISVKAQTTHNRHFVHVARVKNPASFPIKTAFMLRLADLAQRRAAYEERKQAFRNAAYWMTWRRSRPENIPDSEKMPFRRPEWEAAALLAWAWENGRTDVLEQFGFNFSPEIPEP